MRFFCVVLENGRVFWPQKVKRRLLVTGLFEGNVFNSWTPPQKERRQTPRGVLRIEGSYKEMTAQLQ